MGITFDPPGATRHDARRFFETLVICGVVSVLALALVAIMMTPAPPPTTWLVEMSTPDGTLVDSWTFRGQKPPELKAVWGGQTHLWFDHRRTSITAPVGWRLRITELTIEENR